MIGSHTFAADLVAPIIPNDLIDRAGMEGAAVVERLAKLYTTKTPITAADMLNDKVLPFHEEHGLPVLRILGAVMPSGPISPWRATALSRPSSIPVFTETPSGG